MAMIAMLAGLNGKQEVLQSSVVKQVKKAVIKRLNGRKTRKLRVTMKRSHMKCLVRNIYRNRGCSFEDQRLLAVVACMFYGIKRFDDIINWKVEDLRDEEDGSLSIIQRRSKTDQLERGTVVTFPRAGSGKVGPAEILRRFLGLMGKPVTGYIFCAMRGSKKVSVPTWLKPVGYDTV